jgi:predicted Ser/Thr protein kinase
MLAPNTQLQNRYLIDALIGKGGMGAVYLATDQRLRSTVALKETLFHDESLRKAFEREAHLLANLRHPALPVVMDYFAEANSEFLVMQFIPGEDLAAAMIKNGQPFSSLEVLPWLDQLLDALGYLHNQTPPIIHRDIKPQNLKLTPEGQIILLDFGLAKGTAGQMSEVTSGGSLLGFTPGYAPLEQIQGAGTEARSDLFALAATVYHLLTCQAPPDVLTRTAAIGSGEADPLRSACEINASVPPDLGALLLQAMSLKRERRPASAAEMRALLNKSQRRLDHISGQTVGANAAGRTLADTGANPTLISPSAAATVVDEVPAKTAGPVGIGTLHLKQTRWRIPLIVVTGVVALLAVSIAWWRYSLARKTAQSASASSIQNDPRLAFKVAYPVVNGQWTYSGWDAKRFNEKSAKEQEDLKSLLKAWLSGKDRPEFLRSGQWHAVHMFKAVSFPVTALTLTADGKTTCSTCHLGIGPENVDREFPRLTCAKCHVYE